MKRLLLLTIGCTLALHGCRVEKNYGHAEPTRPGFYMFRKAHGLSSELFAAAPVFAFALYYAETDETKREELLAHLLPSYSIVERTGDEWQLIDGDNYRKWVIDTGGKSLYDDTADWTYVAFYPYGEIYDAAYPTIGGSGAGAFTLRLPEQPDRNSYIVADLTVRSAIIEQTAGYEIGLTLSGDGTVVDTQDIDVDFDITTPLEYIDGTIENGAFTLMTTNKGITETAQATYLNLGDAVKIEYDGYLKNWLINDDHYYE